MRLTEASVTAVLALALLLVPCGAAFALPTSATIDGQLDDWLPGTVWSQITSGSLGYDPDDSPPMGGSWWDAQAGINASVEDGPNAPPFGWVEPGYGGQNFDIEAMYAFADDTGLYVAVATGFDRGGVEGWNGSPFYRPGDLFIDFGADGSWDLAIETFNNEHSIPTGSMQQPEAIGGTFGEVYGPATGHSSDWWTDPVHYAQYSRPAEIEYTAGYSQHLADDAAYPVLFAYSDNTTADNVSPGNPGDAGVGPPHASGDSADWVAADHNALEAYFSMDFLVEYADLMGWTGQTVAIAHWTEQCGNDFGNVITVDLPPIPEPSAMVILGCLGVGMFAAKRMKRKS